MAIRKFRYDVAAPRAEEARKPVREDRPSPRLVTRITFARTLSRLAQFRVLAERPDGAQTLVCFGATREEALEAAHALSAELPRDVLRLRLEEWRGGICAGRWQRQPWRQGELPALPARRPRHRQGRQAMQWQTR